MATGSHYTHASRLSPLHWTTLNYLFLNVLLLWEHNGKDVWFASRNLTSDEEGTFL